MLKAPKTGWKKLDGFLKDIAEVINRNKPLRAYGIYMDETPSGTFIATVPIDDNGNPIQPTSSSSSSADDDSGLQIQISLLQAQVAVLQQEMPIGQWKSVTVVDPANGCAQSTIYVFVKS